MMDYQMRRQVKGSFLSIININRKMSRTKYKHFEYVKITVWNLCNILYAGKA